MRSKLAFILLLASSLCWAQDNNVIQLNSLNEAISVAMERNLSLTINELYLEKAKMELKLAKSEKMPQINGSFSGQKNLELATTFLPGELVGQPGETVATQFGQEYQYNAGININKPLIDLSNRFSIKTKTKDVDIRNADNSIYQESLVGQVYYSYHAFILAKEALQIGYEDLKVADSILQITHSKFNEGLLDLAALNRSKINLNRVKQSVDESTLIFEDSQNNLRDALGLEDSVTIEILERKELNVFDFPEAKKLSENLEILKSEQYKSRAKLNLKLAKSEYLPTISLTSYFGSQLFQNEFDFSLNDEGWAPLQYVGVNVNLPIFNGLSTRRKVKIAKIDAEVADLNHQQEKNRLEGEDKLLLKNHDLTASMAISSLENYKLYKEISELEFSKYTEGLVSLETYLNAFEDYLNAKNAYLNALTTYYQYYAKVYSRS